MESKRKSWHEIFEPVAGGLLKSNNSHFTPPVGAKKRKFPGASRKGYGPVNAPAVAHSFGGMTIAAYGSESQAMPNGEGGGVVPTGGAMGESVTFMKFLDRLETSDNKDLMESIRIGYIALNS